MSHSNSPHVPHPSTILITTTPTNQTSYIKTASSITTVILCLSVKAVKELTQPHYSRMYHAAIKVVAKKHIVKVKSFQYYLKFVYNN